MMMPACCTYCSNAQSKTGDPNARCNKHEGSALVTTAPERIERGGSFLPHLSGLDRSRPVPVFDDEGRRIGAMPYRKRSSDPLRAELASLPRRGRPRKRP